MMISSRSFSSRILTISVSRRSTMSQRSAELRSLSSSISRFMASQTVLYFSISKENSSFMRSISSSRAASFSRSSSSFSEESTLPSQPSCSCSSLVSFSSSSSTCRSFCSSLPFSSRFSSQSRVQMVSEGALPSPSMNSRCTPTSGLLGKSRWVTSASLPRFAQACSRLPCSSPSAQSCEYCRASASPSKITAVSSRSGSHPVSSPITYLTQDSMASRPATWRYLGEARSSSSSSAFSCASRSRVPSSSVKLLASSWCVLLISASRVLSISVSKLIQLQSENCHLISRINAALAPPLFLHRSHPSSLYNLCKNILTAIYKRNDGPKALDCRGRRGDPGAHRVVRDGAVDDDRDPNAGAGGLPALLEADPLKVAQPALACYYPGALEPAGGGRPLRGARALREPVEGHRERAARPHGQRRQEPLLLHGAARPPQARQALRLQGQHTQDEGAQARRPHAPPRLRPHPPRLRLHHGPAPPVRTVEAQPARQGGAALQRPRGLREHHCHDQQLQQDLPPRVQAAGRGLRRFRLARPPRQLLDPVRRRGIVRQRDLELLRERCGDAELVQCQREGVGCEGMPVGAVHPLRRGSFLVIFFNKACLANCSLALSLSCLILAYSLAAIIVRMKAFDIGELKKTARVKELEVNRSYSEIHKSPLRSSTQENLPVAESYYLTRWGRSLENREEGGWVNVGQGIVAVSVGEEHALILNNKNECYGYGGNSYGQLGQEAESVGKPAAIHALKDMKVMAVFCGAYHSIIQNAKGELYSFGFNLKGQLGLGSYEDKKKPVLVHSLLPGGTKNPKASFFADSLSECRRKQRRSKEDLPELANITNLTGYSPLASKADDEEKPVFLLAHDEVVLKTACGPLHSVVLTNKGRLFSCGYGEKFALGTGRSKTVNEFTEIRLKSSGKIERLEVGNSTTGYVCGGRAWIAGTLGEKVFESFTALSCSDDVVELKMCERNAILLTRKGELYQVGEYYRDGERCFTDSPKKVEKMASVKQIWSGATSFFALSESKGLYGWGDNTEGQISGISEKKVIPAPQSLRLAISCVDSVQVVAGSSTTFLLSGQKIESPSNEDSSKNRGGSVRPSTYLCGPEQKQLLSELGVQPRVFNCNMEIDFDELIFESQISEGGYGIIYKGLWRETTVAIKMFKIESDSAVRDFFSECAAMEALRHPNVVMFLGACTKSPNFAIILEFCSRGSLWSNIQNLDLPLSWQQRKRMALQTARGVHYLHSCTPPVLHRDLKSLNLLLDESGRVKLADFGWTKGLDNYMTGKIGTYQWMAPEVIASQKYSEKADVFSYGIILWEIASREPPFKHLTGLQVSLEVLNNDLRPPIPKKTPEVFAKLMRKCWDREPSKRPSFKEVIRELQAMKF